MNRIPVVLMRLRRVISSVKANRYCERDRDLHILGPHSVLG
jgi:hypothetical protein